MIKERYFKNTKRRHNSYDLIRKLKHFDTWPQLKQMNSELRKLLVYNQSWRDITSF